MKKIMHGVNTMKKCMAILLIAASVFTASACEKKVVPDIVGVEEEIAKNVLSSLGLVAKIEYIYDDNMDTGNVVKTEPSSGEKIEENGKVSVYVSKGEKTIFSKASRITWKDISYKDDLWEFYSPYIDEEVLYIDCCNVTFGSAIKWKDKYLSGKIFGEACVNDTFDKTVPVSAVYEKQSWQGGESQKFILEIPLRDLEIKKPTNMYLKLFAVMADGRNVNVEVSFSMTW